MDLDIKRVLQARPGEPEPVTLTPLVTPWGEALDEGDVLAEHPRPQFQRSSWTCLNGLWDYAVVESGSASTLWRHCRPPKSWEGKILVPFSPEAALSRVGRQVLPCQLLWYRRIVNVPELLGAERLLLHFEAVDYACACWVNGRQVDTHVGGYLSFDLDITDAIVAGDNTIELCVWDPSEQGGQLRGKQRLLRGNMWYTAQSGIWQTVWMERVPEAYISTAQVTTDADAGVLYVKAHVSNLGSRLVVSVLDAAGKKVAHGVAMADGATVCCEVCVPEHHLWDICDPYLYGIQLTYGSDRVSSYCAFRNVGVEPDEQGVPRFCLNHRPLFVRGLLDQGYWPDGLMTAPSDEAFVADIQTARDAGFNMLRKHIKLEADRWYWHCDRLGMLVWQDMVSGGGIPDEWMSANIPTLFRKTWTSFGDTRPSQWKRYGADDETYRDEWLSTSKAMIRHLVGHPCIASWVVFNESWGQFQSAKMTEELSREDDTRPFVSTSGWYDQGAGDFFAVHNYFRGMRVYPDVRTGRFKPRRRAFMINEFGGLVCPMEGHTSVPTVYGYDTFEDVVSWRKAYEELLASVDALEAQGLAGYVYTQLCDVEEETNGLVTYDRRVNKLKG